MFWSKKKCDSCKEKISHEWNYCPNCGISLRENNDILRTVEKDFKKTDKIFNTKIPKFLVRHPLQSKGISITITSDNFSQPKIEVRTSRDFKIHEDKHVKKPPRIPKETKEPETKVERIANKQVITLNLPDVKSLDDIEIKKLHQSIEVKAFAGDKAYFKLIPIPSHALVNREFKNGVLRLEVEK